MIMAKCCSSYSIQPICIITFIRKIRLTFADICSIHEIKSLAKRRQRSIARIAYFCLRLTLTTFSGNDDNTISTTSTIDSSSRSILQNINTCNILRSYSTKRAFNTIYKNQRCVATIQGYYTTKTDSRFCIRVT